MLLKGPHGTWSGDLILVARDIYLEHDVWEHKQGSQVGGVYRVIGCAWGCRAYSGL